MKLRHKDKTLMARHMMTSWEKKKGPWHVGHFMSAAWSARKEQVAIRVAKKNKAKD